MAGFDPPTEDAMWVGFVLALLAVWPSAGEGQVPRGSLRAGVRGGVALAEVVTRVGFETTVVLPAGGGTWSSAASGTPVAGW